MSKYIPQNIKEVHERNDTLSDTFACMYEFNNQLLKSSSVCQQPLCKEMELDITSYYIEQDKHDRDGYHFIIHFQTADTYKTITEKERYPIYQLLCSLGGVVCLVFGGSYVSLIELLLSLCITILAKLLSILLSFQPTRRLMKQIMSNGRYSLEDTTVSSMDED